MADAYDAALRGELHPLDLSVRELSADRSAMGRACLEACRGLLWFASPAPRGTPVDLEVLRGLAGQPAEVVDLAARALAHEVRAGALALDADRVGAAGAAMRTLVGASAAVEGRAWLAVADGWWSVMSGHPMHAELESAGRDAARVGRADLVLEATAVRSLPGGVSIANAIATSRRASRMSRTEGLPHSEYLANLALARSRRLDGNPHLATRILRALLAVAPPPWRPWLEWELALATGELALRGRAEGAPSSGLTAARALLDVLAAARAGDVKAFDDRSVTVEDLVHGAAPLRADFFVVRTAIDPRVPLEAAPSELVGWARGETAQAPRGLFGVLAADGDEECASVISPAHGAARRVLGPGAALSRALQPTTEPVAAESRQLRTDSVIAALALARPEGAAEDALFRSLYGFAYEPVRHQAVRDTLYARVRKRIAPVKLERDGVNVRLSHQGAMLVPDPRCAPPPEMKILRVLAERAGAAPKDVADELGIPLRTAQDALARLAEDGAVRKEKARLGLTYVLEDTTFSEPTAGTRPEYEPPTPDE